MGKIINSAIRNPQSAMPLRHLPLYFSNLFQKVPGLAAKSALERQRESVSRLKGDTKPVAIFIGCSANYFYPDIIDALTEALTGFGIPYIIPPGQVCCGMPALLSGDEPAARRLMKINKDVFNCDTIITVCPTCNRMLTEMPFVPQGKLHAECTFASLSVNGMRGEVIDAIEFLQPKLSQLRTPHSKLHTCYHQPCHSQGTKAPEIIRSVLKATTDYQETAEVCCGGGGLFTFKYPELSDLIGKARMASIEHIAKGIEDKNSTLHALRSTLTLVTNCPGCMMQLEYLLSLYNLHNTKVCHIIKLLKDTIPGKYAIS